jgi:hypothetical protein
MPDAIGSPQPEWYAVGLAKTPPLIPVLELSAALNAVASIAVDRPGEPRDLAEARNHRLFAELTGSDMISADDVPPSV